MSNGQGNYWGQSHNGYNPFYQTLPGAPVQSNMYQAPNPMGQTNSHQWRSSTPNMVSPNFRQPMNQPPPPHPNPSFHNMPPNIAPNQSPFSPYQTLHTKVTPRLPGNAVGTPHNYNNIPPPSGGFNNIPPPSGGYNNNYNIPQTANFSRPPPPLHNPPPPYSSSQAQANSAHYGQPTPPNFINMPPPFVPIKATEDHATKEVGCQKLSQWLQGRKKQKKADVKSDQASKPKPTQVWSFMNNVKKMQELINSLSSQVDQMSTDLTTADDVTWEASKLKCDAIKEKLHTDFGSCFEAQSQQMVHKKLSKARQKRARLRRKRQERYEEQQLRQLQWDEKSKDIDKWQERLQAKIQEENKEKRRKVAADCTLSQVTRKIHDATRLIDTMFALQKLRLIRRDAAQKRGDTDIGESRQQFEEKIKDMTRLVEGQLECYKEEEAKLKQFLKSEEEEKSKMERKDKKDREREHQVESDKKLREILFGPNDLVSDSDPLLPFNQYYMQGRHSLPAFLQIRQEWDSYLVPKDTPSSSSIPNSWILPDEPSCTQWATALQ